MKDGRKAVWSIPYVSVAFFPSLKQNFIAYRSSKVSSRPDCIFEIHQLWQSGFSRMYSNCCCSCSFEPEIIKIDQSSHKMYNSNILNFQESTTIFNARTKKVWKLIEGTTYVVCICGFSLDYLCYILWILHYDRLAPISSLFFRSFFTSLNLFFGRTSCYLSRSDVFFVWPSSILVVDQKWQHNHNVMCTNYRLFMSDFFLSLPLQPKQGIVESKMKHSVSLADWLIPTPKPF